MKSYKEVAEVAATLVTSGQVPEAIQILEGYLHTKEAAGKSFYDYQLDAEEYFLQDVAPLIKHIAGGHAEKIKVQRGRSVAWLEYQGQDRSDLDMSCTISITTVNIKNNKAFWHIDGTKVFGGAFAEDIEIALGALTPELVAAKFAQYFNA